MSVPPAPADQRIGLGVDHTPWAQPIWRLQTQPPVLLFGHWAHEGFHPSGHETPATRPTDWNHMGIASTLGSTAASVEARKRSTR